MGIFSRLFGGISKYFRKKDNKKHPLDEFFQSFLSKTNLSAPILDQRTALLILNIDPNQKQIQPKYILERYYVLYKKNQPKNGGTIYLQSKIKVAKQTLMSQFPNAVQAENQYYKQVIEPEQKAEQQKNRAQKQEQEKNAKKEEESKEKKENQHENDKSDKSDKSQNNDKDKK